MKYTFTIASCFLLISLYGQMNLPAYSIHGEQVIYEFDVLDLDKFSKDKSSTIHDFSDFDIKNLIYSGEYKNWSKDGWTMRRVSRNHYQLCKDLDDFDGVFPFQAKYLIDGRHWASPRSEPVVSPEQAERSSADEVFKENQKKVSVSKDGNITFQLSGFDQAQEVVLSGSFNGWQEKQIFLIRNSDGWKITLDVPPGIYEYKFIVDGQWIHDPANNMLVKNQHDTYNSILLVGEDILFTLPGHQSAKEVILSGSFNSWNEKAIRMSRTPRGWTIDVPLPPGKHFYKFIVDGKWITDPTNELIQKDRQGYVNSVLLIH